MSKKELQKYETVEKRVTGRSKQRRDIALVFRKCHEKV